MPFYVAPEQLTKDRADFARKGIARGRSVVALRYAEGVLMVAENHSASLHKISEIYDRIGFAAVGRYNEFENLRIAGIRYADLRGYAYDRGDVTARGLANAYAQQLGAAFASGVDKPFEVELIVAEVGSDAAGDNLYRLTFDGSIQDERDIAAMGGGADAILADIKADYDPGLPLPSALHLAVRALSQHDGDQPPAARLEVAVLDRTRSQLRKFRRLSNVDVAGVLDGD